MTASDYIKAIQEHVAKHSDQIQQYLDAAKQQFDLQKEFLTTATAEYFPNAVRASHVVVIDGRAAPLEVMHKLRALSEAGTVLHVSVDTNTLKVYATIA